MPAAPSPDADFMSYLGYWSTLQGFLTYSFGWTRHDRGLRWWYDAGRPTDDPRFALINSTWERDGLLLRYAEWCHDRLSFMRHQPLAEWTEFDSAADEISPAWSRRLREARVDAPTADSPHGKHLEGGDHSGGPAERPSGAVRLRIVEKGRAVLVAETSIGWYRALIEHGRNLPPTEGSSWRVDVFVKPIGFVGTYRQSWRTGLWFSGRHRHHSVGT